MTAKRAIESQALKPDGKGLPLEAANPTRRNPAGMRRNDATKKGPYFGSTSFIATMAVPQKKNGDTNTAASHNPSARQGVLAGDSFTFFVFSFSSSSRHSTFCPVPTQSRVDGGGGEFRNSTSLLPGTELPLFVAVLLEHGTLNLREDGVVEKREEVEGGNELV